MKREQFIEGLNILYLNRIEGKTYVEIAEMLGISKHTAWVRGNRAWDPLRKLIKND